MDRLPSYTFDVGGGITPELLYFAGEETYQQANHNEQCFRL